MVRTSFRVGVAALSVALVGSTVPVTGTVGANGWSPPDHGPLIEGLAGPLGLAVAANGDVYVSEAFAGRLTRIGHHGGTRVLVDAPGTEIAGLDVQGSGKIVMTQTIFDGPPGEEAPVLDAGIVRVRRNGSTRSLASTFDFENANNPDQVNTYGLVDGSPECLAQVDPFFPGGTYTGILETHPYAIAHVKGGYAVADAAGNAILRVRNNGRVSTVAVLPPIPQTITQDTVDGLAADGIDISACLDASWLGEPVPTDIEVGDDGYWYVSTLPGFPEAPGAGAVWRLDPDHGTATMMLSGLTGPVDIAVDHDGSIVVAELFAFQITRFDEHGAAVASTFADSPGAVEIGPDGTVYAAVGVFSESGSVITVDV